MPTDPARSIPRTPEALKGTGFPLSADTAVLRAPQSIGRRTAPNRIVYQAMEGCDGTPDGAPGELTRRRYARFAAGGPGIIWVEATAVAPEARANPHQLWLTEQNLDAFARLAEDIRERCQKENGYTPLLMLQLTHSGRYSKPHGKPEPLIAYKNPLFEKDKPLPDSCVLSDDYLDGVTEKLVRSAQLAQRAGFDGADIKCCHRYLLCELLSAYTRPGRYGGSFENRTRLLREAVAGAVQSCSSDFIVTSRLNIYDGFPRPYGFGMAESGLLPDYDEPRQLARLLCDSGLSLLDVTMGNPYVNPHVNRPFVKGGYTPEETPLSGVCRMLTGTREVAAALEGRIPVICSGLTFLGAEAPAVAAGCIKAGWFQMAGWGRQTLAYPDLARDILQKGGLEPKRLCLACSKCTELMRAGGTPGCVVRDSEVYLPLYTEYVTAKAAGKGKTI